MSKSENLSKLIINFEEQRRVYQESSIEIQKAIFAIGYTISFLIILAINIIFNRPITLVTFANIGAFCAVSFEIFLAIYKLVKNKKLHNGASKEILNISSILEKEIQINNQNNFMEITKNKSENSTIYISENTKPILYTECWCNSPYHSLRWHICEDGLSFEIYLKPYNSFWQRVKNALRYIFKNEYTHCGYDEFEITKEDLPKIKSLIEQISQKYCGK